MNKIIGKLICAIHGAHPILIGNEQDARLWVEMIDAAVETNGFALLRCSRCGEIVTRVVDDPKEKNDV